MLIVDRKESDMKNQPLFTIIFEDDTKFVGGVDYLETRWLAIPHKQIRKIFYRLSDGNHLCLGGYDKYYHIVEVVKYLSGEKKGQDVIQCAYIMGKKGDIVTSYRINLIQTDKHGIGDITRREFDVSSKFIQGLNSKGWR